VPEVPRHPVHLLTDRCVDRGVPGLRAARPHHDDRTMFVVVAIAGVLLLITSQVFGDWLGALEPDLSYVSGTVVGAFLAAFGGCGWIAIAAFGSHGLVGLGAGAIGGLAAGWLADRTMGHPG